ncbi:MAG: PAQR family membrane homeostasis protein TrhA [Exilispira sp.]
MSERNQKNILEIKQEIANSITHGLGAALSIAALTILVVFASLQGNPWKIVSFSLFGASLILLYVFSTLYHSFTNPKVKRFLRILDHCSIFILIAGTYTPITLVTLRVPIGWTLFGLTWGMAICGIIFKSFFTGKYNKISILFYIFMGWIIIFALKPLIQNSSTHLLIWFLIGGACYTLSKFIGLLYLLFLYYFLFLIFYGIFYPDRYQIALSGFAICNK